MIVDKEKMMSQNAPQRLYLMQVGSMPEYQIPIACYLVQTGDGRNILIDTGLPQVMPAEEKDFENGRDVIEQLVAIGLKPDDIDTVISTHYDIEYRPRRQTRGVHQSALCGSAVASFGCGDQPTFCPPGAPNGISPWNAFSWWTRTRNCCQC
jgi:Metallo-beta-lactamase superfamily